MSTGYAVAIPHSTTSYSGAAEVTTSDSDELPIYSRAIYVGSTGAMKITTVNGDVVTFAAIPAGITIPVQAKLVWENGTDADGLVALY